MEFKNKWIWITGASSGIGRAVAVEFSTRGANLVLLSRNVQELEVTASMCHPDSKVLIESLDLANQNSILNAVTNLQSKSIPIDLLFNNGGISQRATALDTEDKVVRQIFETNFFGTVSLTKALLPQMIKQGGGHIAIITSVVGIIGSPKRSSYSASKHALHGYFDSLRAEYYKENIKVTIICPGYIKTNVSISAVTGSGVKQGTMDEKTGAGMEPSVLANKIAKALARQKEEAYFGGKEILAIYLKRYLPGFFSKILRKAKVT